MDKYCLKDIVWAYDKRKGETLIPILIDDKNFEIKTILTNKTFTVDKTKYNCASDYSTIKEVLVKNGLKVDSVMDSSYAFIRYKLLPTNLKKELTYDNDSYEKLDKIFAKKFLTKKEVKKLSLKIKQCICSKIDKIEKDKKNKNNKKIIDEKIY